MSMVSKCEHLAHPSLFLSNIHYRHQILPVYVDSWSIIIDNGPNGIQCLQRLLLFPFTRRILALLHNSLEVSTTEKGFFFFYFTQCKYAKDLISLVQLENSGPVDTPSEIKVKYTSDINIKYSKDDVNLLPNPTVYRQLIGSLVYLTCFRPYISYVVNIVCQFRTTRHFHMFAVQGINRLSS